MKNKANHIQAINILYLLHTRGGKDLRIWSHLLKKSLMKNFIVFVQ